MKFDIDRELKNKNGIYKISNTVDGRIYIGSAIDFRKRHYTHKWLLSNNRHKNKNLQEFVRKNGINALVFSFVEKIDDMNLFWERERYWIDFFDCIENGFNIEENTHRRRSVELKVKHERFSQLSVAERNRRVKYIKFITHDSSYPDEIWTNISGFHGAYKISNKGRVVSERRVCKNKYGDYIRERIILTPIFTSHNYSFVRLYKNGEYIDFRISRLVAEYFVANPEKKPLVNHLDCDTYNNGYENLEWTTCAENTQHAQANGRMIQPDNSGEKNGRVKLSEKNVLKIMNLKGEYSQELIAKKFNVSRRTVGFIHKKQTWKYLWGN